MSGVTFALTDVTSFLQDNLSRLRKIIFRLQAKLNNLFWQISMGGNNYLPVQ